MHTKYWQQRITTTDKQLGNYVAQRSTATYVSDC